jgi:hypothetical protein
MYKVFNEGYSILAWDDPDDLAEGEVFFEHLPSDAEIKAAFPAFDPNPVVVPRIITRRQFMLALDRIGKLDAVEAGVAAVTYRPFRIEWDNASTFDSRSATLQGLAAQLGFTDEDVDALFTLGATL